MSVCQSVSLASQKGEFWGDMSEVLAIGIYYSIQYFGMTCWMTCPLGKMPGPFSRRCIHDCVVQYKDVEECRQRLPPAENLVHHHALSQRWNCQTKPSSSSLSLLWILMEGRFWYDRGGPIWWFLPHGRVAWWRTSSNCPAWTGRGWRSAQFKGLPLCSCVTWCLILKSGKESWLSFFQDLDFEGGLQRICHVVYPCVNTFHWEAKQPLKINPGWQKEKCYRSFRSFRAHYDYILSFGNL